MGSKNRYAKELLPIILKERNQDQAYVEPFCGGCNIIDKVSGYRIANDINKYLIAMWKQVVWGWEPPEFVSEKEYADVRDNKDKYPPYFVGFVGFGCSYSGKWFGGYARGNTKNGIPRNYADESRRNILQQGPSLAGVVFRNDSYLDLYIPPNSIVYCDPPYADTTKYTGNFNYGVFWQWVRATSENNTVYVSEYHAPKDFTEVWNKVVYNTLTKNTGSKQGVEKLFVLNNKG